MGWLILLLILLEEWAAASGLTALAGDVCHAAVDLGMYGPCLP